MLLHLKFTAIKRLGGGKGKAMSASQRWRKQKASTSSGTSDDKHNPQQKADMLSLTGYADELLANGQLEIYQDTYEKLAFLVKKDEEKNRTEQSKTAEPADDVDIFADDVKQKGIDDKVRAEEKNTDEVTSTSADSGLQRF